MFALVTVILPSCSRKPSIPVCTNESENGINNKLTERMVRGASFAILFYRLPIKFAEKRRIIGLILTFFYLGGVRPVDVPVMVERVMTNCQ